MTEKMFNDLSRREKAAYINALTRADLNWIEFLIELHGGRVGVAMEIFYRDKGKDESTIAKWRDNQA